MPRKPRELFAGTTYHVLNRAGGRATIFDHAGDYNAFCGVLREAVDREREQGRRPPDVLGWVVMPNHWHLVLRPHAHHTLSDFMRWLTVTHTQRYRAAYRTGGTGPLYQGRFKSFPVQGGHHLVTLLRYIERNPVRANLVADARAWRWGSATASPPPSAPAAARQSHNLPSRQPPPQAPR